MVPCPTRISWESISPIMTISAAGSDFFTIFNMQIMQYNDNQHRTWGGLIDTTRSNVLKLPPGLGHLLPTLAFSMVLCTRLCYQSYRRYRGSMITVLIEISKTGYGDLKFGYLRLPLTFSSIISSRAFLP